MQPLLRLRVRRWRHALPSLLCTLSAAALVGCAEEPSPDTLRAEVLGAAGQPLTCVNLRRPLSATSDATITTDPLDPTRAASNVGGAILLSVGTQGSATLQSLLSFDLSSVPANVPIASATLRLTKATSQGPGPLVFHTVTAPWSEAGVTYNNFAGAFSSSVVAALVPSTIPNNGNAFVDLTGVVSQWNAGTLANHGLLLEEPTGGRVQLASSEAVAARRPLLTVCYQPPTCGDGLQNQGEGGIDCGGPCAPCFVDLCLGVTCAALDACHVAGTCDSATGQCDNPAAPAGAACDDGNACTTSDVCDGAGSCSAGSPVTCAPPGACQLPGACDPQSGQCAYPAAADGTPCADADVCNGAEACLGGQCAAGTPLSCSDGYACTTETCDPTSGCVSSGGPSGGPWERHELPTQPNTSPIRDLETDAAGNTYVLVELQGQVDMGLGPIDSGPDICDGQGQCDHPSTACLVAKYDASGVLLWNSVLPTMGGVGVCHGLGADGGGVYVAAGERIIDPYWPYGYGMLHKVDPVTGAVAWTKSFSGDSNFQMSDVAVTSAGLPVVARAARYYDSWFGAGPWSGTIAAYNPATGAVSWSTSLGAAASLTLGGLAADGANGVVLSGSVDAALDVGAMTLTPAGYDLFAVRLDGAGSPVWQRAIGGVGSTLVPGGVALDAGGNAYLSATATGNVQVPGGPVLVSHGGTDVLFAKLDPAGGHVFGKLFGGTGAELGGDVVVDPAGLVSLTGSASYGAVLGGGPVATGYPVTFLATYDGSGAQQSQRILRFFGPSGPTYNPVLSQLSSDCAGHLYATGTSNGDADLGFGAIPSAELVTASLPPAPAATGTGSCSGGQFCDATGCSPAGSAISQLACSCGSLDAACGVGSCGGGTYCEGGGCGNPQCFAAGSDVARAMCGGGTVAPACTVSGGMKRVFVSSTVSNGNMGGTAGADATCQSLADAAALGGTYRAYLSDGVSSPAQRMAHFDGPYVRTDGAILTTAWYLLMTKSPPIQVPINKTETGAAAVGGTLVPFFGSSPRVWAGQWVGNDCNGWTSSSSVVWGTSGSTGRTDSGWANEGTGTCNYTAPIYCFEQ
jgi:hypothetical protein